ncbi:MAG TPA: hypothetical protein VEX86_14160 [Longimicrobium sp.]|nr:hypothetical protein [Longimicrobium sp.]
MRMTRIVPLLALAAALPLPAAAQRYGATSGARAGMDTTVAFASGDEIRVTSYPSMATGVQLCGTVSAGMHWGKMMMANAGGGTTTTVVTFPSAAVTAQCQPYRYTQGDWLALSFTRTVRDDYGRIARMPVGEIVLPMAPLRGRRVTFRWQREGPFNIGSITPAPDTLGPPRP